MKAIIAILFSLFFLLTTMQQTSFYLLYKLNEKSITEKYCVNKNVKNSSCKGSCHLNKTIANAEKQNSSNPFSIFNIKLKEVEIFFKTLNNTQEIQIVFSSYFIQNNIYRYVSILLDGFSTSLIKPPNFLG